MITFTLVESSNTKYTLVIYLIGDIIVLLYIFITRKDTLMKKLALLALSMALFISSVPITYANPTQISSTVSEEMIAMNNLGLVESTTGPITKKDVKNIILKLNSAYEESFKTLLKELDSTALITEGEFYASMLQLLGYEKEVDFKVDEALTFAESIGLNPSHTETFTSNALAKALNDCLKSKTKDNREYFEVLIESGFLSDYNEGKEVPEILVFDGKTQPIFNHDEAIYERVYVESPQDTDLDGKRDLIEVWVKRPLETEQGMKVPVIFEMSPYGMGTNDDLYKLHNVDEDLTVGNTNTNIKYTPSERIVPEARKVNGSAPHAKIESSDVAEWLDFGNWYNYFLPRGYAVVFAGGIGTRGSEGMTSTGSVEEIISTTAVIDWLNGRTKAFTNKTDNIEVKADWSTGNVGMSGRSYRGTLPIGTAATGVEGLKTIVPVAAISNWYDYYRRNGLNLAGEGWQGDDADLLAIYCMSRMFDGEDYAAVKELFEKSMEQMRIDQDRVTGDYNAFWDERNYLNNVDKMEASVLIVHGLSDWNVMSNQFDGLWKELEKNDVPRKMILHQGEHISINNLFGIEFNDMLNRWFDYWLYEIDNNIMEEMPTTIIQNNTNLEWENFENWPVAGDSTKLYLNADSTLDFTETTEAPVQTFKDDLSLSGYDRENPDPLAWRDTIVKNPEVKRADRLAYVGSSLTEDVRISGTINLTLKAALDKPTGIISAMLVDYGTEYRPTIETEVVTPNAIIYGGNAGQDDIVNFVMESTPSEYKIISRGWMDAQNHLGIDKADPLKPGAYYTFNLDMQPMDYTVKAGHKLGLILYSTDAEYTMRPLSVTNFTVDPNGTFIEVPVVNGLTKW